MFQILPISVGVRTRRIAAVAVGTLAVLLCWPLPTRAADDSTLLNVSYDPTRELYKQVGAVFGAQWEKETGQKLTINQSHGGSGTQARAVIDGLDADVVTLAMWPDTDAIRKAGLISSGWEQRFPNNSVPYTSTIVFAVRKGNPKGIKDWPDLIKPDVHVVTPSPKTSGNGKLSFLAAWGSVTSRGGTEQQAQEFVTELYEHAPVLDSGARGSTVTFAEKGIGDVHLAWENEARLEADEHKGDIEIVYPPVSFLAEPPVAVVDTNTNRKGTTKAATAYLSFLYTPEGQELAAKNYYRPISPEVLQGHAASFPRITLFSITATAKDWTDAYNKFFVDGAIFDRIYRKK
jgi:sulfate/thiosulfate transport system substrate-binding protein